MHQSQTIPNPASEDARKLNDMGKGAIRPKAAGSNLHGFDSNYVYGV